MQGRARLRNNASRLLALDTASDYTLQSIAPKGGFCDFCKGELQS